MITHEIVQDIALIGLAAGALLNAVNLWRMSRVIHEHQAALEALNEFGRMVMSRDVRFRMPWPQSEEPRKEMRH